MQYSMPDGVSKCIYLYAGICDERGRVERVAGYL
jgi:hypothetical protein